ncbi:hypothetical protein KY349_00365 [Candidatus Woesearchaeota archaeon]|jgi:hypothetical protein|nr:hypothetical protein [Candidatus Woesearchaeota archaeon]
MKKAQVAGQIFIYITAIVIVGLIIVYGYSAIKGFTERGEEVEYITMQKSVENAVKSIASDYGSVKRPDIDVPGKYELVCFVDKGLSEEAIETSDICQSRAGREKYHQPIVCSGWKTGRNNVFLIPDGSESFDVGNIVMEHGNFLCFDVFNNKINLQLTGLGDRVEISSYS